MFIFLFPSQIPNGFLSKKKYNHLLVFHVNYNRIISRGHYQEVLTEEIGD